MFKNSDDLISLIDRQDLKSALRGGLIGIEKESLRMSQSIISQKRHRDLLGAPLYHKFITTDFSDAQLEFITPPFSKKEESLAFLNNLHHFVSHNIGEEYLWPFSMPMLSNNDVIPIAEFGNTNEALFKEIYRKGLSNRYGSIMQTISGVHFNYSLPNNFWKLPFFNKNKLSITSIKSSIYFRTLRNLERMNWLILYLFGCSPIVTKSFINNSYDFIKLNNEEYYLPYATSLRMSDIGYQNTNQANLFVSLDQLDDYISDLRNATEQESKQFKMIYRESNCLYPQINGNILQIEDEYYAASRPKSVSGEGRRQITKLSKNGVDYIESRSLDLNPFSKTGIEIEDINFLEIFMLYCTLKPSETFSRSELQDIKKNNLLVCTEGRKANLRLNKGNDLVSFRKLSNEVLSEMSHIAEIIGNSDFDGEKYKDKIVNPELTPSGILLEKVLKESVSFKELGNKIAHDYKNRYLNKPKDSNILWDELVSEEERSYSELKRSEAIEKISFDQYLKDYFR